METPKLIETSLETFKNIGSFILHQLKENHPEGKPASITIYSGEK